MLTPQEVEAYFARAGVKVQANRGEWRDGLCPFHEDRSRSFAFNINSGGWKCHAGCGEGGLKEMAARTAIPFAQLEPKKAEARAILEKTYDYTDENGDLLYQAVRYKKGSTKTFKQRRPKEGGGWEWSLKGTRLVLYKLQWLVKNPTHPVFLVEGEKDADNLTALGFVATTSPMGAGKWRKEYAELLKGRVVYLLPDNDKVGFDHMDAAGASLQGVAAEVRALQLPDLPPKGDASDWLAAGGTADALWTLAKAAPLWEPPEAPPPAQEPQAEAQEPFLPLGYGEGHYYYLSNQTQQVIPLTANQHAKLPLLALAPIGYWAKAYGGENGQIAWTTAASELMTKCARMGVFDHTRIRGRGAWHENGQPVIHMGDGLVIDGKRYPVGIASPGGFIYPASIPLRIDYENPLSAAEANKLIDLCDLFNWERKISARFLAGWCAIAPICGAIAWRPHLWLTGAAGSGKSWIMDNFMRPMLGKVGLFVQSDTTEAGIRQALGYDARPVLFDEAEGESERAQVRLQNVLALMRQSSSENGSVIVKGSTSGQVKVYCIRSCFAFSSIGVGIKQHSDSTRISVLALARPEGPGSAEKFAVIRSTAAELLTPKYIGALHARMVSLIPVIRENAQTFAHAAALHIGSQRMGDQVGALLAGCYALKSDGLVTAEHAAKWVKAQDWADQVATQETPDEVLCLNRILQHIVKSTDTGRTMESSIGEMILNCDSAFDPDASPQRRALMRLGIRVEHETVTIANQHSGISGILAGTPWSDWSRILRRFKGAEITPRPVRFAGVKVRGVVLPREYFN